jgi:hypothetical protein
MAVLQTHFPDEWEYNGDGKVILNGLVPDFVNKNGQKAVIEVFGDYWHSARSTKHYRKLTWHQTELGRTMAYNALGFHSLILWEKQLFAATDEQLADTIKRWFASVSKTKRRC